MKYSVIKRENKHATGHLFNKKALIISIVRDVKKLYNCHTLHLIRVAKVTSITDMTIHD